MNRRLHSLDVFRGMLIIHMVMGNSPGNEWFTYPILTHAVWDGWTVADVVPAGFLWLMGVCMPFVLQRRMALSRKPREVFIYIVRRSLIIFLIGMALQLIQLYDFPDKWSVIKFTGILQRIGLSYLFAGTLFLVAGIRGQVAWTLAGPLLYWLASTSISVPGYGTGSFDPEGNAASYFDLLLLGYHAGNSHSLLSLLTTTATVSLGILTGNLLKAATSQQKRAMGIFLFGMVLIVLGIVAEKWVPVNRRLWTPSFVFLTAGMLNMSFCVFYLLIDVLNIKKWTYPFEVFGLNPLFIFSFSEIGRILANKKGIMLKEGHWVSLWDYTYRMFFLRIANPLNASLLHSTAYVFLFFIIASFMYHKNLFVKI